MVEKESFYDVKEKAKFETDKYDLRETEGGRYFIVAKSQSGPHECWKVVGKDKVQKLMAAGLKPTKVKKKAK